MTRDDIRRSARATSPGPWGYAVTATSVAAGHYTRATAALIAGSRDLSRRHFEEAVHADPSFALAWAALACTYAREDSDEAGKCEALGKAAATAMASSRPERHHVAIIRLLSGGDRKRGIALARDHLLDYPGDELIRIVATRDSCIWCSGTDSSQGRPGI